MEQPHRVVRIPPGVYPVGNDSIPAARPKHQRRIDRPYWIDVDPVAVGVFARFVCRAGYGRAELWGEVTPAMPVSVDARCDQVRQASGSGAGDRRAVAGLNGWEAAAIARFAGGRLPFEIEWEIAVATAGGKMNVDDDLLEWTADVYSPVYWRADYARRGVPWSGKQVGATVAVRGFAAGELVQHVSARRGIDPHVYLPRGGLRLAWDVLPPKAEEV